MVCKVVNRRGRLAIALLMSVGASGLAGTALADTVHFEAESARDRMRGTITSPMLIKDDPAASGGSYITVRPGLAVPHHAPASTVEGVARYTFSVADTGSYRIWARVSAANDGDDSFWVRMGDGGPWIRFNGFALGAAYHWVLVAADPPAAPSSFALTGGSDYQLQVAYREDGTRLDAFYVTSDSAFNPNAAITGPPAPPIMQEPAAGGGATKVSWSAVPGAVSYTVEFRTGGCSFDEQTQCCEYPPFQTVATGLRAHKYTGTATGHYRVTAVAPTGSSSHPTHGPGNCNPLDPSQVSSFNTNYRNRMQVPALALTPPLQISNDDGVGVPAGTESLNSPPAHGRARVDFELAAPAVVRVWAEILAPNPDQDSFWVQFNDATWIKWNNLNDFCETLYDSNKPGSPIVRMSLPAGSHRLEFAHREGGARLYDSIIILEDSPNQGEQCSD